MAASLETNKILAAILTAGIFASGAGVVSRILYHPTTPEEPAYVIEVAAEGEEGGGGGGEGGEVSIAALLASADAAAGESVSKKCGACHTFDEGGANKIGPNLHGVIGRDIASVSGFEYSEALTGLEGSWDYEKLDGFLSNPKGYAPGTKMTFAGVKAGGDRANLIMYLRSQSPDAPPLPEPEEAESAETQPAEAAEPANGGGETAAETSSEQQTGGEADDQPAGDAQQAAASDTEQAEAAGGQAEETGDAASSVAAGAEDKAADAEDKAADAAAVVAETAEGAGEKAGEAAKTVTEAAPDATKEAGDAAAAAVDQAGEAAGAAADKATDTAEAAGTAAEAATGGDGEGGAGTLVAMLNSGDAAAGEKIAKKCKACHVFEEGGKNRLGPGLWGVVGRDIGSHEGYKYSQALAGMEGAWDYQKLDQFLAAPKSYAPGTKMTFAGIKDEQDRADVILYLRSLAADPAPLPGQG